MTVKRAPLPGAGIFSGTAPLPPLFIDVLKIMTRSRPLECGSWPWRPCLSEYENPRVKNSSPCLLFPTLEYPYPVVNLALLLAEDVFEHTST